MHVKQLENQVCLITGSSAGLGQATAQAYAAEGARVVVNYLKSEQGARQTAQLVEEAGGQAMIVQADVTDEEAVKAMVQQVMDRWGRIDILVNNAGLTMRGGWLNISEQDWDHIFAVNLKGPLFCSRAVVPVMRKQESGHIINMSSQAGLRAGGSSLAYCVAKAGVVHFTKLLAFQLAPQIRVNCIAPGSIHGTDWHAGRSEQEIERAARGVAASTPMKMVGSPDDIAGAAVYLATAAEYITGLILPVDGGRTLPSTGDVHSAQRQAIAQM
jgi:3-oxoacyl-[acyl-carrier protein] reductase